MTIGVGTESMVTAKWLHDTLKNDGALTAAAPGGVWDGPATEETSRPLVRFDLQSDRVVRGVGTVEIMTDQLWLVRGVVEGSSYAPLADVATRIQALLHGRQGVIVTGGTIEFCVREQQFRQGHTQGGRQYRHLGGIYRINTQGS